MEAGSTKVIGALLVEVAINMWEARSPGKGSLTEAGTKVISTIAMLEDALTGEIGGGQGWEMATGDSTPSGGLLLVL